MDWMAGHAAQLGWSRTRNLVEGHRHGLLDAGDDVGDGPAELEVGEAREQMAEHDADLAAGEVGAEAEVRAAAAERHVGVGLAPDVELLGIVERTGVAVGGREEHRRPGHRASIGWPPSSWSRVAVRKST